MYYFIIQTIPTTPQSIIEIIGDILKNGWIFIAGGIISITLLWKYVLRPVAKFIKKIAQMISLVERKITLLHQIEQNLSPNGGKSLFDAVARIESLVLMTDSRQRAFLGIQNYAFFEADKNGACTYVNAEWSRLTGVSYDDASGNGWVSAISDEDRDDVHREWKDAVENKRIFFKQFNMINRIRNEEITVTAKSIPIRSHNDTLGYIGIVLPSEKMPLDTEWS